ncbi:hypothetical protein TWF730_002901 [Orbilia blumenaviensis]|uniref:CCHC-type domain-containing protein n=1 Tax=Orbilia blumenaviensis TaxID=1796055 RepID=A0AAV9U911_9PEZI
MEEPQAPAETVDNGATNVGLPIPEETSPQIVEATKGNRETRMENAPPEIMDLTGDGDTLPTETIPGLSELPPTEEQPVVAQPMENSAKLYTENLAQHGQETRKRAYPDDGSSDSDDDSDMMDDSGITLNLQDDTGDEDPERNDEPQVITIESSSDEEIISKGRSKKQKVPEPFNRPSTDQPDVTKSNGAIAVSAGLKLGKSARATLGVAKITRMPLAESISLGKVKVVDYSIPGLTQNSSESAQTLKGISPTSSPNRSNGKGAVEVINLISDPVDPTDGLSTTNANHPAHTAGDGAGDQSDEGESASDDDEEDGIIRFDEEDEDDDDDGVVSDGESVSSVDTDIWAYQQKYYVRQPLPPLLHEDYRKLFTPDISGSAAAQKALVDLQSQESPKKRKICDVCMEPHLTERCDKLKCDVCDTLDQHFSFNCPYKTSANKKVSDLPIFNVPVGQKDFEIWRIMPPQSTKPIKKASKIPMACYECGDDDHFGDDCPSFGKRRLEIPTTSIWNAKAASKWTTMNMESKHKRNGKAKFEIADDSEPGWFEARIQAVKTAIPDSNIKRDYLEQHRFGAPSRPSGNPRPHIQMNLPRTFPGQDSRDDRGGASFTRYQGPPSGGRFAERAGGRNDHHYRPDHSRRERSRSPRRPSFGDRVGGYGQDRGSYRDRPQDFPRGQGNQATHRGNQGYHAVPPPPPQPQNHYGQGNTSAGGGGWSLPGSIQLSVQSSSQPPLPPGPPPGPLEPPPPPPPPHRRNSGRGGRGRGFFRGKRGGKH